MSEPTIKVWDDRSPSGAGNVWINVYAELEDAKFIGELATTLTISVADCTIRTLSTEPQHRGKGYAGLAVQHALTKYLTPQRCPCVGVLAYASPGDSHSGMSTESLHAFYGKFGFVHCEKPFVDRMLDQFAGFFYGQKVTPSNYMVLNQQQEKKK